MRWITLAAIAAVAVLVVPATAQQQREDAARGTVLNVNAQGLSLAPPDMATITVGVEIERQNAREASAESARRMSALVQSLRRAGLASRDIQTAFVRLTPVYDQRNERRVITSYRASNNVRARVRAIQNTGRILDAAASAGGNTLQGISFSHQTPDTQLALARRDAARSARAQANLYAEAMGMRVVRVISITEAGAQAPSFFDGQGPERRVASGGYETPVAPGELETRAQISVSYELR